MWLDRFSNHPTPSASPPPGRSSFQANRRPSHLGLGPPTRPGGFSPRSSSLNVSAKFNSSTSSLNSPRLLANGSTLRQEIVPPPDFSDPLAVLEEIVGKKLGREDEKDGDGLPGAGSEKPEKLVEDVPFEGKSLQDFVNQSPELEEPSYSSSQTVEEYEKDKDKFEDLHRSIIACDDVLRSVEVSLTNFKNDLGTVSAEIETLQNRSVALNTKLENRKVVEKLLGPAVEEISIAPGAVRKISEGSIDQEWIDALKLLEKRSRAIETNLKESGQILAVSDVKPLLDDLTKLATVRIRDFLVSQIKALRSPNINAQIIQQQGFLAYKDLFAFLASHHPQLAEQISQAYSNTMRWYYLSHFARYKQALEKIPLYTVDKSDALGADQNQRTTNVQHPPSSITLGRRLDIVARPPQSSLPSHVAEDIKNPLYIETPFHAFSTAVIDNASFEYAFLTTFFPNLPISQLNVLFTSIFSPTFALGDALTKSLIESTYDCFGILLCVRVAQHLAFELQRRKCPVVDGYINGTNMLLWPRFQIAMEAHVDSVKRAASTLPSSSARATLSLSDSSSTPSSTTGNGGGTKGTGSTAPHMLTQRFGTFLQGILSLSSPSPTPSSSIPSTPNPSSSSAVPTETPISRSLSRLRGEFEAFLERAARPLSPPARRDRFMANNYGLVLTIIGDTGGDGALAEEIRGRWEGIIGNSGPG